jgi:hypothetical protein
MPCNNQSIATGMCILGQARDIAGLFSIRNSPITSAMQPVDALYKSTMIKSTVLVMAMTFSVPFLLSLLVVYGPASTKLAYDPRTARITAMVKSSTIASRC